MIVNCCKSRSQLINLYLQAVENACSSYQHPVVELPAVVDSALTTFKTIFLAKMSLYLHIGMLTISLTIIAKFISLK